MPVEEFFASYPWFMPSHRTLRFWLNTRKSAFECANNLVNPGIFKTYGFFYDRILFLCALVFEFIGLLFFYIFSGVLIFVVMFFVLDLILVAGSHWYQARWTELKTQLSLLKENESFEFAEPRDYTENIFRPINQRIAWRRQVIHYFKIYRAIFYFLLFVIALYKAVGFLNGWMYAGVAFSATSLMVCCTCFFVALIHVFSTGYFGSEMIFRFYLKREIQEHILQKMNCNSGIASFPPQPYLQFQISNPDNLTFPTPLNERLNKYS